MPLFSIANSPDKMYCALRDCSEDNVYAYAARKFIIEQHAKAEPYLDSNFAQQFSRDFHGRCWELHLVCGLLNAGLNVIPRCDRGHGSAGPDFLVTHKRKRFWFEAIAVTAGQADDRVVDNTAFRPEDIRAHHVQDNKIMLRLRSGLEEKHKKYLQYLKNHVVSSEDGFIIAINSSAIGAEVALEVTIPRIVKCVLPIGHEVVHINTASMEIVGSFHEYCPCIIKQSGSAVSTTLFQDDRYSGISAVLYSGAHLLNDCPYMEFCISPDTTKLQRIIGGNFYIVHNSIAKNPFPREVAQLWREYWLEDEQLRWKNATTQ